MITVACKTFLDFMITVTRNLRYITVAVYDTLIPMIPPDIYKTGSYHDCFCDNSHTRNK